MKFEHVVRVFVAAALITLLTVDFFSLSDFLVSQYGGKRRRSVLSPESFGHSLKTLEMLMVRVRYFMEVHRIWIRIRIRPDPNTMDPVHRIHVLPIYQPP